MSRAKITFFPRLGTADYTMNNVTLVSKYSGWNYDINDFATDGYIYTDNVTNISTVNNNYWVKFKPVSGYKFTTVHKTNSSGESNQGEFEIDSDGSVVIHPWNSGTSTIVNNYLYVGVTPDTSKSYNVTTTLTNCKCNNNETPYEENTSVTLNIDADVEYIFNDAPVLTMGDTTLTFTISDDMKHASITFTITSDVVITGVAVHEPYRLFTNLENCSCNYSDVIPSGRVNIILTADDGYIFHSSVRLYNDYNKTTNYYDDFIEDGTKLSIWVDVNGYIEIDASCIVKPEQLGTFVNLYKVDNNILTELSKVRFVTTGETTNTVDYGSFITSIIKVPFVLPNELINSDAHIQLGNYDSGVNAPVVNNYLYSVSLGTIAVPEKYHNIYDYKETRCFLHLPFTTPIELDVCYVVNQVLTLEYKIDLYSGSATVNVISSFTNAIVDSKTFNIAFHIPFIQQQENSIVNKLETLLDNGIKQAFIEVVRNVPYNVNSVFGNECYDFGTLENYVGYVQVDKILLNINAPNEEKNEIINLLSTGVYINETNNDEV